MTTPKAFHHREGSILTESYRLPGTLCDSIAVGRLVLCLLSFKNNHQFHNCEDLNFAGFLYPHSSVYSGNEGCAIP